MVLDAIAHIRWRISPNASTEFNSQYSQLNRMCILLCFSIRESSFGTHTDASLMCSWGRNPSANGTYIDLAINVKRWTEWAKDSIVCVLFMWMRICVYASNRASLSHSLARSRYLCARAFVCVCVRLCIVQWESAESVLVNLRIRTQMILWIHVVRVGCTE